MADCLPRQSDTLTHVPGTDCIAESGQQLSLCDLENNLYEFVCCVSQSTFYSDFVSGFCSVHGVALFFQC
jgi:hypothetical protein